MSDIDNGICTKCNLTVAYVGDEWPDDDDGLCIRGNKSYCTNKHEHIDWRERWKGADREAAQNLEGWRRAKRELESCHGRSLKLQQIIGWDGTTAGCNFDVFCQQVIADRDQLRADLAEARRERDLAIAHDRQSYPTAWAYEQACKALEKTKSERDTALAELERVWGERNEVDRIMQQSPLAWANLTTEQARTQHELMRRELETARRQIAEWAPLVAWRHRMEQERDAAIARARRAEHERDEWRVDYYTDPARQRIEQDIAARILSPETAHRFGVDLTNPSCPIGTALTGLANEVAAGAWRAAKGAP